MAQDINRNSIRDIIKKYYKYKEYTRGNEYRILYKITRFL